MTLTATLAELSRTIRLARTMMSFSFFSGTVLFALVLAFPVVNPVGPWIITFVAYLGFTAAFAAATLRYRRAALLAARELRMDGQLEVLSPLEKGLRVLSLGYALGFAALALSVSSPYLTLGALIGMGLLCLIALWIAKQTENRPTPHLP